MDNTLIPLGTKLKTINGISKSPKLLNLLDNFETTLGYHGDGDYLVTIGGALWAAFGQLFDKCGERLRLFLGGVVR